MIIDPHALDPEATYKLLTGVVVPRPIAWVTTRSRDGVVNLAPFSAFTFVSNKPPMIGFNIGRKAGVLKDTGNNIHATREYVVHIAAESMVEAVHFSAVEYPPEVSEPAELGLELVPSDLVTVPRLAMAPIAMECRWERSIPFGLTGSEFTVGEIVRFHVADGLVQNGKIDTARLRPLCRLAGPNYATLGEIVQMKPIAITAKQVLARS